jgi:hypothetical protein
MIRPRQHFHFCSLSRVLLQKCSICKAIKPHKCIYKLLKGHPPESSAKPDGSLRSHIQTAIYMFGLMQSIYRMFKRISLADWNAISGVCIQKFLNLYHGNLFISRFISHLIIYLSKCAFEKLSMANLKARQFWVVLVIKFSGARNLKSNKSSALHSRAMHSQMLRFQHIFLVINQLFDIT